MALNVRERAFAEEYIINHGNAYKAAIKAGYSKNTAKQASLWLDDDKTKTNQVKKSAYKPELAAYINAKLDEIHSAKTADAKEVVEYLSSVLRGESESEIVVIEGSGDGITEARRMTKRPDEKERLKAADILAKIHGITTANVNVSADTPLVIINDLES